MNAYHDIRSVRSWLNRMYPDATILIQRNAQASKKPFFFIEGITESFQDHGYGWYDTLRALRIHLVTEASRQPDGKQDTYWKTLQVTNALKDWLIKNRIIPAYLWSYSYPFPYLYTSPGGTFDAGTYQFAITAIDSGNHETLLSTPLYLNLELPQRRFYLSIPNWPMGRPIAQKYVIYYRATDTATWDAIKEVNLDANETGNTLVEVTSLVPLSPLRHPPQASRVRLGQLKVDDVTCSMLESFTLDDAFDAYVQVRFYSRAPRVHDAAAPMNELGVNVTVGEP